MRWWLARHGVEAEKEFGGEVRGGEKQQIGRAHV